MAEKVKNKKSEVDVKHHFRMIDLHRERTKKFYEEAKKHNYLLYNNETDPMSHALGGETKDKVPRYNLYYADVETWRDSTNLRNPRVFIKPKRENFYIIHRAGETEYKQVKKQDMDTNILKLMEAQGITHHLANETEYTILNGKRSSKLIETNINNIIIEKDLETVLSRADEDAHLAGMSGVWVTYKADQGVYRNESEFIKNDDVTNEFVDLEREIYIDPFIRTPYDLHKAKEVGRLFEFTEEEVLACKDSYDDGVIEDWVSQRKDEDTEIKTQHQEQAAVFEKMEQDEERKKYTKVYKIWEIWQKPTIKEMKEGKPGHLLMLGEGYTKKPLKKVDWPHDTDKYPLHLLFYNIANDRLYPSADIKMYEPLLNDRNVSLFNIRNKTKIDSAHKVFYDKSEMTDAEISKFLKARDNAFGVNGNPKDKVFQLNPPSLAGEWYSHDAKFDNIQERITRIPNIKRGTQPARKQTATETYIQSESADLGSNSRIHKIVKFLKGIVEHNIDLIQQYYTVERQVMLTGNTEPEWATFTKKDIQGDYSVDIDVYSMMPNNDQLEQNRRFQLLNLVSGMVTNPMIMMKLLTEGKTLEFSQFLKDYFDSVNLQNEKVFSDVDPDVKSTVEGTYLAQFGVQQLGGQPGTRPASGVQGGAPKQSVPLAPEQMSQGQPTMASEAQKVTAGGGGMLQR